MSVSTPARRLPIRCLSRNTSARSAFHVHQRRMASSNSDSGSGNQLRANPVLEEYRRKNPEVVRDEKMAMPEGFGQSGDIASSSIFEDERRTQQQKDREAAGDVDPDEARQAQRDPIRIARVLQPDPGERESWERRKVIQMVRKRGRLNHEQYLKRTEREHTVKSHNMKTSTKKLGMLARQIAGKPIDEAIVQMRFSKKKVAQEVLKQLEAARDEAVVMRGMGLGNAGASPPSSADTPGADAAAVETSSTSATPERPLQIMLKNGKRHSVPDKTQIYIDQAWVGRGPYGQLPDYRARGRVNIMRTPWTSISVVLKEEATRVRQFEEREAKRLKRLREKVWTAMPDRPIQIQRQWYSW